MPVGWGLGPLPCPECRFLHGRGGAARIGNYRNGCTTCNNFVQNVMRLTRKMLAAAHPEEYATLRARAELDLYPQVMEDWNTAHPIDPPAIELDERTGLLK